MVECRLSFASQENLLSSQSLGCRPEGDTKHCRAAQNIEFPESELTWIYQRKSSESIGAARLPARARCVWKNLKSSLTQITLTISVPTQLPLLGTLPRPKNDFTPPPQWCMQSEWQELA